MLNISNEDFLRLVTFVKKNYGIDLSQKKLLIEGRLCNTVLSRGFTSFKEYIDYALASNSTELEGLLNRITTNHTYFMRESSHFDIFKNIVLPKLEKTKRNKTLSIWSAGCATGEEPYTLSMILKDYFERRGNGWDTRILATDISQRAIDIAKFGEYKEEALSDVPSIWRSKYFTHKDGMYTLIPQIKDNVIFRIFNLMSPITFKTQFDVIFCRNVMIYFDMETKTSLIQRLYNATASGGYLFIGHSESLPKDERLYTQFDVAAFLKE